MRKAWADQLDPTIIIVVVPGARDVRKGLAVDRALKAMRRYRTVGKYLKGFAAECMEAPLPSKGTPATILRWLQDKGAVAFRFQR